jgi:hypothetical protein
LVPLANSLNLGEHGLVMAADQQHFSAVFQRRKLADDFDGVGLAECEVENDDLRGGRFEFRQHRFGIGENLSLVASAGEDMENHGADLGIVIEDVCDSHRPAHDTTTHLQTNFIDQKFHFGRLAMFRRGTERNWWSLLRSTVLAGR